MIRNKFLRRLTSVQTPPSQKKNRGEAVSLPNFFQGAGSVRTQANVGKPLMPLLATFNSSSLKSKRIVPECF